MVGFNNPDTFYEGVEVVESFEKFFRPLAEEPLLTPVMLTLILDLYFRLTPNTMVEETQEIIHLAKTIGIDPALVASPMISSLTDMLSVTIYFMLAVLFIGI